MKDYQIKIKTLEVSAFQQNCKLIYNLDLGELLCIDPGSDVDFITENIKQIFSAHILKKVNIVLTHCHIDHCGGVKDLLEIIKETYKIKADLYFHKDCDEYKDTIELQAKMYGLSPLEYKNVPAADFYLEEDSYFEFLGNKIKILFTPGHAQGHISLYFEELSINENPVVIAGDALFRESIGRTDLPGGNFSQLINSIKTKLFTLPDNTIVFSGHGPNTTISHEKNYNPFIR